MSASFGSKPLDLLCTGSKLYNTKGGKVKKNRQDQLSLPFYNIVKEEKKYTLRDERLKNKEWAMGLEHEVQYFYGNHFKIIGEKNVKNIKNFLLCDTETILKNYYDNLNELDKIFMNKVAYEITGRRCNNINITPNAAPYEYKIKMPEFITSSPFSSIEDGKRGIDNFYRMLIEIEDNFFQIINKSQIVKEQEKIYGDICQYPFGMSSYIKQGKPMDYVNKVIKKLPETYEDYLGSYHFTFTLPYDKKDEYTEEDQKKFIEMHRNFGAMFQWIEPLLTASFFSCDEKSVGTVEKRIKGSYRVARVGWGNYAGSNVKKFKSGIGRYANVKPHWRENFDFYESEIVKHCTNGNPDLRYHKDYPQKIKEFPNNAVSVFSSNLRTFGPNPYYNKEKHNNQYARISGYKMEIPNGIEIRIFDHFETCFLIELLRFIVLVAANSERVKVKNMVYKNKPWIQTVQNIMLHGWIAEVSDEYIKCLGEELDIFINPKTFKAFDVLVDVNQKLWEKNKNSDLVYLLCEKLDKPPNIPEINRRSWEMAFLLKLSNNPKDYKNFISLLKMMEKSFSKETFKKYVLQSMGKNWKNDWENILYFLQSRSIVTSNKNVIKPIKKGLICVPYLTSYEILFELKGYKLYKNFDKIFQKFNTIKDNKLYEYLVFTKKRLDKIYKDIKM